MCSGYYINNEDEIIEMREIIQEVNELYKDTVKLVTMKVSEIFPTEILPIITLLQLIVTIKSEHIYNLN